MGRKHLLKYLADAGPAKQARVRFVEQSVQDRNADDLVCSLVVVEVREERREEEGPQVFDLGRLRSPCQHALAVCTLRANQDAPRVFRPQP